MTVKVPNGVLFLATACVVFGVAVVFGIEHSLDVAGILMLPVGVLVFIATAGWLYADGDTQTQLPFYLAYAANALFWAVVVMSIYWAIRMALRLTHACEPCLQALMDRAAMRLVVRFLAIAALTFGCGLFMGLGRWDLSTSLGGFGTALFWATILAGYVRLWRRGRRPIDSPVEDDPAERP